MGLHALDLAALAIFVFAILLVGLRASTHVSSMASFLMPRRFGKYMMMMHAFGTGTHSDQAVSVASKSYTNGLSGIWYQWLWLFCTPFYWLIAPMMRRFRALTTADVFDLRYGPSLSVLFAVVGLFQYTVVIGVMLKGSAAIVGACTGGCVSEEAAIAGMAGLFVLYGVMGGLSAAIVTDFIQGIMTVLFSFMLLPLILDEVGGLEGLRASLVQIRPGSDSFSLVAPAEIGVFFIAVVSLNALVGIVTQPHIMGVCSAGRTEEEGQIGFMGGNFVKRFCTMAWALTGLAAIAYYAGSDPDPDRIFGMAARDFLPGIAPGLLGVFLASLIASVMSSCDSFMVASAGLFTENIYKPLVRHRGEGHYLAVVRLAALLVVAGGVFFAYRLPGVVEGLEIFWKIAPMMGIAFWLGLFWRRATWLGAWAATLAGFGAWFLSTREFFVSAVSLLPRAAELRFVFLDGGTPEIYQPWQMIFYLAAGVLAGVVASWLSRPAEASRLEHFFALIRTPVREGENVPGPCMLPVAAKVPPRRNLLGGNWEVPVPSLRAVTGFLAGWVLVAALVGGFYWLTRP